MIRRIAPNLLNTLADPAEYELRLFYRGTSRRPRGPGAPGDKHGPVQFDDKYRCVFGWTSLTTAMPPTPVAGAVSAEQAARTPRTHTTGQAEGGRGKNLRNRRHRNAPTRTR